MIELGVIQSEVTPLDVYTSWAFYSEIRTALMGIAWFVLNLYLDDGILKGTAITESAWSGVFNVAVLGMAAHTPREMPFSGSRHRPCP
jgi:hypothetical protein